MLSFDMPGWRRWWALQLRRSCIAGDETEAGPAGVQAVAAEHVLDAVGRKPDPSPVFTGKLGTDPLRAEPPIGQSEGKHTLFNERGVWLGIRERRRLRSRNASVP